MNLRFVSAWACGLALVGALPSQDVFTHNPVPVRIESRWYGYRLNPAALQIECYIYGEETSSIRLSGGTPGAQAVVFCGVAPASIPTPIGHFLVSPDCIVLGGWFDAQGMFDIPLNLGQRELRGTTLYLQGAEVTDVDPGPMLSWGLALKFVEGNLQPRLGYHQPPMQAFFCRNILEEVPILHSMLVRFEAAQSYALTVDEVTILDDKVRVYVTMKSDGGPFGPNQWHRKAFEITERGVREVPPIVEVWVKLDHGFGETYALGAVIDTRY